MERLEPGDPRSIGAYRLIGRLGAGGMGRVFLARSDRGRTVAVKLIHERLAQEPLFRTRFRQEVTAARRVGGEWTAPVLDADTEAEVPWVATGYIAGPSLEDIVARDYGRLPEASVRVLAAGLGRALEAVHAAGIVHRDLKPSNVLLTLDGPRVIDFGIARALHASGEESVTHAGTAVGSPAFMAPEQVRGERLTPAGDVFSLGSVLVYAASGRMPFGSPEGGVMGLMFRITHEEPDLTGVPEGLWPLVGRCLAKDPAARPTPEEVVRLAHAPRVGSGGEPWLPGGVLARLGRHAVRLLEVEEEEDGDARAVVRQEGHRAARRPRRLRGVLMTAAVALVTTLAGLTALLLAGSDSPGEEGYAQTPSAHDSAAAGGTATTRRPGTGSTPGVSPAAKRSGKASGTPSAGGSAATPSDAATDGGGASPSGTSTPAPAGDVPPSFLGTWTTDYTLALASHHRELTITQGRIGTRVITLTGTGKSALGARYTCTWTATLTEPTAPGTPLRLSPTTLTHSQPTSACTAEPATTLTLIDATTLRREWTDGSRKPLTFTKG
ncbi:Serine/threonine-protein kinase PknD [Streptomyces sp. RB5]|uniref:Serine/threonine-protein kinase PknD n=1 Tax=Streptomyces smaragdinus TaxID=2585196 RepID=A0A7K0CRY7_9ACTN|nr:serine/threonine-protein kinase [Streptomyces smaragdinus]MQY15752.1 Serine/threonine-protein kinase PknD [Streptomyces smaragdinus]